MASKARPAGSAAGSLLILAGVLACCLAAFGGFLTGAHHSGALTTHHQHPTALQPCAPGVARSSATHSTVVATSDVGAAVTSPCPKATTVVRLEAEVLRLQGELDGTTAAIRKLNAEVVRLNEVKAAEVAQAAAAAGAAAATAGCLTTTRAACAPCKSCPKCPQTAAAAAGAAAAASGSGKSGPIVPGAAWGGMHGVNAMALMDLLLPNFPPRKDNNPKAAVLLTHGGPRPELAVPAALGAGLSDDESAFEGGVRVLQSSGEERAVAAAALSACDEVSVVVTKGDGRVCLALLESYDAPPYHVFRMRRRGGSAEKPMGKGKGGRGAATGAATGAAAAGKGAELAVLAAPTAWVHASRYENKEGHQPSVPGNMDGPVMHKMGSGSEKKNTNASALLLNFLNERPRIDVTLQPLLWRLAANAAAPADEPLPFPVASLAPSPKPRHWPPTNLGPVVVLAVNGGVLDLVLNFLCSTRRQGLGGTGKGGDVLQSTLVFGADDEVERAMAAMSVATFRHAALGSFPSNSAHGYGDDIFTSMMWLKVRWRSSKFMPIGNWGPLR